MAEFIHLHSHTQFSLLDGAADIGTMMDKAVKDGMKAVALTDHGNMFGAFKFVSEAEKRGLKGIVGCEFYIVDDHSRKDTKRPERFHQLLLAKNQEGYKNLSKLCSIGYIDGMFGKFPCVDKNLIAKYSQGLIATSCCIGAEIPQAILKGDLVKAEKLLRWWVDVFGEDYYVELQRHRGLENIDGLGVSQEDVNQQLIKLARKYNLKLIATNDSHYVDEEDSFAHDILLCVNTGSKINEEKRFKFPSNDFYFKTQAQMSELFSDVPEAIANTMEVYDKTFMPKLKRDILLPSFQLPQGFSTQFDYLRFLSYQGARANSRYNGLGDEVKQRIDYELGIIQKMGFEGYFLIVQDFINAAREMGVSVGPGRGSAAGSAVAFCLGITNIDPIKYKLLFERFLNPERVSMPDIDIDFDDYGRQDVIDWVVDKYGRNQVAQIITFGTMAAKSSIKDVARVLELPLPDSNKLAGYVPSKAGTKLGKLLSKPLSELSEELQADDFENVKKLREVAAKDDEEGKIINQAKKLEGSVRNTGIHAAGVIIAPQDLTDCIPICTSKDADLLVTQFDGSIVESAGMLKMDFLGLKTLSIIKDCIENIVLRYGEEARIDPDRIPFDDLKTMQLFQRGDTVGIFQFESPGMQKYLKELRPTNIEDLIAMNALYRPGPMDYIPSFINRKAGREQIEYPHEWLEPVLKDTYGIMVYQEQIMQTAQVMADYSLGQADLLRRAMGKKKKEEMDKQSATFIAGATKKGVSVEQATATFEIMTKFAAYGFNRSHSAAYSVVAFQTAYLKANYPAEYMASVLTHNSGSTEDLSFFLSECKAQGIAVLNPDINESGTDFTVNKQGKIRFGLSALKGVGEGMVEEIIAARQEQPFRSIGDFVRRVNAKVVNKKCMESLAQSGAFDSFGVHRQQFFHTSEKDPINYIETLTKYAASYHKQQFESSNSLFGSSSMEDMIKEPNPPACEEWALMQKLKKEQEVMGIFISGHPLNDYQLEYKRFATPIANLENCKDKTIVVAGVVTAIEHRTTKKGAGFGKIVLEDYESKLEIMLFSENYLNFKQFMEPDAILCVKGEYKKSWQGDKYEFMVKEIRLLESVGHDKMKQICLQIPLEQLDSELIEQIDHLTQKHAGDKLLSVHLFANNLPVQGIDYIAFKRKITINNDFASALDRLNLKYTVH